MFERGKFEVNDFCEIGITIIHNPEKTNTKY